MQRYKDIGSYIETEETVYNQPIDINGWSWSMKEHIKTTFYYLHGRLLSGNDDNTPVKNITRRIIKLAKTLEDIEAKDIVLYVDDPEQYHLSFLAKKYYDDVFSQKHDLDTFLDECNEQRIEYGGSLIKKIQDSVPEIIDLQSIAFCDQTDILKGPIAFKHFYNPSELMEMARAGWGEESNGATGSIQDLIDLSEQSRQDDKQSGIMNETPGNYIEIYEVYGVLPKHFLTDKPEDIEKQSFVRQFQIVGRYKNKDQTKSTIVLFRKEQKEPSLKFVSRDKVYSRALGFGGVEELFEAQVWTNYDEITIKNMLDSASKTLLLTTDPALAKRQNTKGMDNNEILELQQGADFRVADTQPRSIGLFKDAADRWENYAQGTAFATDPLLGEESAAGTPFRAIATQVNQGKGPHERDKGKYAKFIEGVTKDWILDDIADDLAQGATFLAELSSDDMNYVADCLVRSQANQYVKEQILSGQVVNDQDVQAFKDKVRQEFVQKGNKHFVEIIKGEFKKIPLRVKVNVAGKQKDLMMMVDKLSNVLARVLANPAGFQQAMQVREFRETFNAMLEYSGLKPFIATSSYSAPQQPQGIPSPLSPTPQNAPLQASPIM